MAFHNCASAAIKIIVSRGHLLKVLFYLAPIVHGFGVQCILASYAHFKVALGCCHVHPTRGALLAAGNGAADMERQDEHPPNDQRPDFASAKT